MKSIRYVALLRGINVGGNNKVEMSKLKKVFEDLGFSDVRTYINSGNVIFESVEKDTKKLNSIIEKAIKATFRFEVKTLIRTDKELKKLCKIIPSTWKNDTEQKTDVLFLWDAFNKKSTLDTLSLTPGIDNVKYISGAIIWNIKRKEYNKSALHKIIGTTFYKNTTIRNVNTVHKLKALIE